MIDITIGINDKNKITIIFNQPIKYLILQHETAAEIAALLMEKCLEVSQNEQSFERRNTNKSKT